jgi:hypothetical protein
MQVGKTGRKDTLKEVVRSVMPAAIGPNLACQMNFTGASTQTAESRSPRSSTDSQGTKKIALQSHKTFLRAIKGNFT